MIKIFRHLARVKKKMLPETTSETTIGKPASFGAGVGARMNRTVQIPLTGASWALLQIPYPLSAENWDELVQFLALAKKPLTTPYK